MAMSIPVNTKVPLRNLEVGLRFRRPVRFALGVRRERFLRVGWTELLDTLWPSCRCNELQYIRQRATEFLLFHKPLVGKPIVTAICVPVATQISTVFDSVGWGGLKAHGPQGAGQRGPAWDASFQ
ncbi:hypothetical protein D2Q93_13955 [Alicyclobacillaceae bacterium I2511]|nr:hypothetical protein D2Q93_13955 [Alicyclobacillaceae bacterium I2511]